VTDASLAQTIAQHAPSGSSWTMPMRLLLSPALIGAASAVARRWGPDAGGWVAALPLTSGPVLLVLALERGTPFATEACAGIVLGIAALTAYVLTYGWASRRWGWAASGALGCVAYVACIWPLSHVRAPLVVVFAIVAAIVVLARRLMPHDRIARASVVLPVWDIPLRMAIAGGLVWGLAQLADVVGPRGSGLLAPFPIAVTIMSTFTHRHEGSASARRFLRTLLTGLVSFAVFFLAAGVLLPILGIARAFVAATLGALATHALSWRITQPLR
jgi:hypothetical protein